MSARKVFPAYRENAIYLNGSADYGSRYRYLKPVDYAAGCIIGDCWPCTARGDIDPDYNVAPVPVHASSLGARIV
jgi:hypothetical protein